MSIPLRWFTGLQILLGHFIGGVDCWNKNRWSRENFGGTGFNCLDHQWGNLMPWGNLIFNTLLLRWLFYVPESFGLVGFVLLFLSLRCFFLGRGRLFSQDHYLLCPWFVHKLLMNNIYFFTVFGTFGLEYLLVRFSSWLFDFISLKEKRKTLISTLKV